MDIDIDRSATKVRVMQSPGKLVIVYSFPLVDPGRTGTLVKTHTIPRYFEGSRYTPKIHTNYLAVMTHGTKYVLLDDDEAHDCIAKPKACKTSNPILEAAENICGVSNFFRMPAGCQYEKNSDLSNFFLTVGNRTVYSLSKEGRLLTHCPNTAKAGAEQINRLDKMGTFETRPGCYATLGSATILPSNAEEISLENLPTIVQLRPTLVMEYSGNADEDIRQSQKGLDLLDGFEEAMRQESNFTRLTPGEDLTKHLQSPHGYLSMTAVIGFVLVIILLVAYCSFKCLQVRRRKVNGHQSFKELAMRYVAERQREGADHDLFDFERQTSIYRPGSSQGRRTPLRPSQETAFLGQQHQPYKHAAAELQEEKGQNIYYSVNPLDQMGPQGTAAVGWAHKDEPI
jgi:hypothetical protein